MERYDVYVNVDRLPHRHNGGVVVVDISTPFTEVEPRARARARTHTNTLLYVVRGSRNPIFYLAPVSLTRPSNLLA